MAGDRRVDRAVAGGVRSSGGPAADRFGPPAAAVALGVQPGGLAEDGRSPG